MRKMVLGVFALLLFASATFAIVSPKKVTASIIPVIMLYEKAKNDGDPSPLGHSEETEESSLPIQGEGNFTSKDLVKDGKVIQRRYYGAGGKAEVDIDYTDHGNPKEHPKVPHRHNWNWPEGGSPYRGPAY
ncbi:MULTISPECIES: hypothetical protein [Cohnella]|uniref:hypothetical protein n=1 Tax=Cohnella TaxID=329857 RepID=UPI00111AC9BD|nr:MULTISPECIES: hypothetical protein [Cohnella]MBN2981678.1 hypothetical protein [Cohnella algarum]